MEKSLFLGVDVGSSKTHAMLVDDRCRVVGFGEAGPGNHEVVDYLGLEAALAKSVNAALSQAGASILQIRGAGFGVSGYDWPSERAQTLCSIATLGIDAPVDAVNDAIIGLIAGARRGWGVAVVSGSGSNCWGWDENHRVGQVTGAGLGMGEGSGASELVQQAVASVSRAWSRRGPDTMLADAFVKCTGARDLTDLIEGLVMERYHLNGRAALLVFQAARDGDAVARGLITWAGEALADLAVGVIHQLEFENKSFEVILAGSLFNGGRMLIDPMERSVHQVAPQAALVRLTAPPVVGAVLLGMQQAGLDIAAYRDALVAAARAFQPPNLTSPV